MIENIKEIEARINNQIDSCNMAYKVMDKEGNVFIFEGVENGFPSYRTNGGSKHIFDLQGLTVIEKYVKL